MFNTMSSQKIHCWTIERVPPDLATGPPFVLNNARLEIRVGRREATNDKVRMSWMEERSAYYIVTNITFIYFLLERLDDEDEEDD